MTRHGIDTERFYQLKKKYSELGDEYKGMKYLRFNTRFKGRLNYVYQLGLADSKEKKNILDIGTGVGYFPYICNRFGHNAMAFDLGDYDLFNDMIEMAFSGQIATQAPQPMHLSLSINDFLLMFSASTLQTVLQSIH